MIMIKSPGEIPDIHKDKTRIFLAGSIEMGLADGWQESVAEKLEQAIKTPRPQRAGEQGRVLTENY